MVIVDQQTVEAIRSARLRLREITLPVLYGSQGERKRCPLREGKAVTLTARVPSYAKHRKAVLGDALGPVRLPPRKSVVVTPISVARDGVQWRVGFVKGDQGSDDDDLFLSRTRDYRTGYDELDAGAVALPSAEAMVYARKKAREKRDLPTANGAAALRLAHRKTAMRKHAMTVAQRRQLDRVGKAIEKLAAELALDSGGIFGPVASVSSHPRPAEAERPSHVNGPGMSAA